MELYWLLRLPHFESLFTVLSVGCMGASILAFMHWSVSLDEGEGSTAPLKTFLIGAVVFGLISCMMPSRSDLALMMGWDAIASDSVQEVIEILKNKLVED